MLKEKVLSMRIKQLRETHNLSLIEIAEIINKTEEEMTQIEACHMGLSLSDLTKICKHYNVSADWMLGISNSPQILK